MENQYVRSVRREGNEWARAVVDDVFEPCDRAWRGLGMIPRSGCDCGRGTGITTP